MVTQDQVREALRSVNDPEIGRPIEDIGMLRDIEVLDGGLVRVHVLITIEGCPLKDRITSDVTEALAPLEGVERVEVSLSPMSEEQRASLVSTLRGGAAPQQQQPTFFAGSDTTVIAVASGKGGVGKSSVTVNLACALAAEGHRVGILDADVWGFSVPRMMGVTGKPVGFNDMILPMESYGVKVISMGFFVPEETPVIWRGPMLHKAIEQFLGDVYWGDLDFLLCDLPPGTGDVSISLASFLPGRVDARRDHAAGGRAQGRGAGGQDGGADQPAPDRRRSRTCRGSSARTAASTRRSSVRAAATRPPRPWASRCSRRCRSNPRCARAATTGRRSS